MLSARTKINQYIWIENKKLNLFLFPYKYFKVQKDLANSGLSKFY